MAGIDVPYADTPRKLSMPEMRSVAAADLEALCLAREALFREAGWDEATIVMMRAPFRQWLAARLDDGSYFGFVALDGTRAIGTVGLMTMDWPPHPRHPTTDRRGYVLNLYVEPESRGRGVARQLMRRAEEELADRGVRYATLHATEAGRPLYEEMGWLTTNEMAKPVEARAREDGTTRHISG